MRRAIAVGMLMWVAGCATEGGGPGGKPCIYCEEQARAGEANVTLSRLENPPTYCMEWPYLYVRCFRDDKVSDAWVEVSAKQEGRGRITVAGRHVGHETPVQQRFDLRTMEVAEKDEAGLKVVWRDPDGWETRKE